MLERLGVCARTGFSLQLLINIEPQAERECVCVCVFVVGGGGVLVAIFIAANIWILQKPTVNLQLAK